MKQLKSATKLKRRGKLKRVLFLHEKATVYSQELHKTAIRENKFEKQNHPSLSPGLAPSDFFLFRNLKSHYQGIRFPDDGGLKGVTETMFQDKIEVFNFKGIYSLKKWAKCI